MSGACAHELTMMFVYLQLSAMRGEMVTYLLSAIRVEKSECRCGVEEVVENLKISLEGLDFPSWKPHQ